MMASLSPPPLDLKAALFLDFDGTLAPIRDNPDTVFLEGDAGDMLLQLSESLGGAMAVLSGRDLTL